MAGNRGLADLIPTVNRLQDAFAASGLPFGLDLPQIAVVGGQSAGKSSVLENFVGKDFLPRGAGIVTRRPLILQLNRLESGSEYAEFLHLPGKKFTNFEDVRKEIENETDRETGTNKGISKKPINLRVYSPHVLDLTLVDLPGMTRVAVGDQPSNIADEIRDMVLDFVKRENTVILAVSPANSDLANSDAMRMAREVDPSGKRTLAVITKIDLMDEGTDCMDILLNKTLPLDKGYIGVVNRSQKDITGNKNIHEALSAEEGFFKSHPVYRDIADRCGTPYLQQKLNTVLTNHIRSTLPDIRKKLRNKVQELKSEMKKFSKGVTDPKALLFMLMQKLSDEFNTAIEGLNATVDSEEVGAGVKINRMFYKDFAQILSLEQIPTNILKREILFTIKNIHGVRNGIFTPDMAFHATVVKVINRFREPLKDCVYMIANVMKEITDGRVEKVMHEHEKLKEEVLFRITEHINDQKDKTSEFLLTHLDAETSFMNIRHEDFVKHKAEDDNANPTYTKKLGEVQKLLDVSIKVLQKGWIQINKFKRRGATRLWFVLKPDTFGCFEHSDESENVFMLPVNVNMTIKTDSKKTNIFTIYRMDGKPLGNDMKTIELQCNEEAERDMWINCFEGADVFADTSEQAQQQGTLSRQNGKTTHRQNSRKGSVSSNEENPQPITVPSKDSSGGETLAKIIEKEDTSKVTRRENRDTLRNKRETLKDMTKSMVGPDMERQVETIRVMVESYLKIVGKTIRDITPKYVMFHLVNNTVQFVRQELVAEIMISGDMTGLFENTEAEMEKKRLQNSLTTAEKAMQIIGEVEV